MKTVIFLVLKPQSSCLLSHPTLGAARTVRVIRAWAGAAPTGQTARMRTTDWSRVTVWTSLGCLGTQSREPVPKTSVERTSPAPGYPTSPADWAGAWGRPGLVAASAVPRPPQGAPSPCQAHSLRPRGHSMKRKLVIHQKIGGQTRPDHLPDLSYRAGGISPTRPLLLMYTECRIIRTSSSASLRSRGVGAVVAGLTSHLIIKQLLIISTLLTGTLVRCRALHLTEGSTPQVLGPLDPVTSRPKVSQVSSPWWIRSPPLLRVTPACSLALVTEVILQLLGQWAPTARARVRDLAITMVRPRGARATLTTTLLNTGAGLAVSRGRARAATPPTVTPAMGPLTSPQVQTQTTG